MSNEAKEQQAENQKTEAREREGESVRERQRAELFHITAITVRKNQNGADVRP